MKSAPTSFCDICRRSSRSVVLAGNEKVIVFLDIESIDYFTVTDFARFLGISGSRPLKTARR